MGGVVNWPKMWPPRGRNGCVCLWQAKPTRTSCLAQESCTVRVVGFLPCSLSYYHCSMLIINLVIHPRILQVQELLFVSMVWLSQVAKKPKWEGERDITDKRKHQNKKKKICQQHWHSSYYPLIHTSMGDKQNSLAVSWRQRILQTRPFLQTPLHNLPRKKIDL